MKESRVIKKHSHFRRVLYMHRNMPLFVSDREVIPCASQIIVGERKGAMMIVRSLNQERSKYWGLEVPPEDPKLVRAEMVKGFMYVEEIDADNCWFHGYMNINPKLALMPDMFLNAVIKRVVNKIIIKLRDSDVFDNDHIKKRIAENPEKFEKIRAALAEAGVQLK